MHSWRTWTMLLALGVMFAGGAADGSEFAARYAAWQGGTAPSSSMPPNSAPVERVQPSATRGAPNAPYAPRTTAGGLDSTHGYHQPDFYNRSSAVHAHCPTCGPQGAHPGMAGPARYYDDGPYHESFGHFDSCGGCGSCGGCNSYGCDTLVWAKFELLLWWREGRGLPPLVTTDPVTEPSTTAGILPNAEILFGNEVAGSDVAAGGRFDIGTWFDTRQCYGVGWRFWGLGHDGMEFNINSLQNPVLAIPFIDLDADANNAFLVAYPGLRTGEINISANSEVLGNDVYGRFLLCRDCDSRWDFITGWHFSRINDNLQIRSRNVNTDAGGGVPLGRVTTITDQFGVQNEFHGGILGLSWERECGCLTTQIMGRMSIGNMRETSIINGSFTTADPGLDPITIEGGLFTAESNIGRRQRDEFTAVTEVNVNLAYRCNDCTQLTLGYTFLYWNDVIRPEDAIDTRIGTAGGETHPAFQFKHADYWVQGLSLGFIREF